VSHFHYSICYKVHTAAFIATNGGAENAGLENAGLGNRQESDDTLGLKGYLLTSNE